MRFARKLTLNDFEVSVELFREPAWVIFKFDQLTLEGLFNAISLPSLSCRLACRHLAPVA